MMESSCRQIIDFNRYLIGKIAKHYENELFSDYKQNNRNLRGKNLV